jgi:DNA mismatch endonuclease (patch repair protein)
MVFLTPEARSALMARIRGKDTAPELTVRRILFALGYRYRLHTKTLPGKPDLVFPTRRKVIFVHGCFWQGHVCLGGKLPSTRTEFWSEKILGNKRRDRRNRSLLRKLGWKMLVVWECSLRRAKKWNLQLPGWYGFLTSWSADSLFDIDRIAVLAVD